MTGLDVRTVPLPKTGLTSKAGTVTAWYVQPGDRVDRGTPVCQVETEKTTVDVPSPAAGTVLELVAPLGVELPVGAPLLRLQVAAGAGAAAAPAPGATAAPAPGRALASPAARRLARELGVNLAAVRGTGPNGLIQAGDVQAAAGGAGRAPDDAADAAGAAPGAAADPAGAAPGALPPGWRRVPLTPMRRTVAQRMVRSARETAPVTLTREVECSRAAALPEPVTITDLAVKAVAAALADFPDLHAQWDGDALLYPDAAHVNLAVTVPGGLVTPVLRRPGALGLADLAAQRRDLAERARARSLAPADLAGGTFTVTNLGMYGVDAFTPIINPPQAAVLGVGRLVPRPVAVGDQVAVRPTLVLSLTFDHRVVDGAGAAQFLGRVAALMADPPGEWFAG